MKRIIFITLVMMTSVCVIGQRRQIRPDWMFEKPAGNSTYEYVIEHGVGATEKDAYDEAVTRVREYFIRKFGESIYNTNNGVKVIEDTYNIPIKKACEYTERQSDGTYYVYVLFQVAVRGNIKPLFEDYRQCNSIAKYKDYIHKKNVSAIVASTFVPGMGQMIKKQGGSGAAFLVSELALFGGGTVCYFIGQKQSNIMKGAGTSYEDYINAKNQKQTWDIAMYTCFGIGAAVHIANMVHAWCVENKNFPVKVAFIPAVIPTNEYVKPTYAMGAGVQIQF